MKVSVSLWSYVEIINNGEMTYLDVIKHIHSKGIKHVEVLDYFLNTDEKKAEAKKLIKQLGMIVTSYSIGNNFVCDEKTRLEQIEMVKKACDWAIYFDTKIIRSFAGDVSDEYNYETGFNLIVESYKACMPTAEAKGITYALENHGRLAGKSKQIKDILDAVNSPNLKANIDTGNFLLCGEKTVDSIAILSGRISLVHFKDFVHVSKENAKYHGLDGIYTQGTVIGEGDVDMPKVVAALAKAGYDGCLSIEYEGPSSIENVEKSIKNSLSYIK